MGELANRLSGAAKIGLAFGALGAVLVVVGLVAGNMAPLTARTLLMGSLLGGGSWGVVSWAIASAAMDAVHDDAQHDGAGTETHDVSG